MCEAQKIHAHGLGCLKIGTLDCLRHGGTITRVLLVPAGAANEQSLAVQIEGSMRLEFEPTIAEASADGVQQRALLRSEEADFSRIEPGRLRRPELGSL